MFRFDYDTESGVLDSITEGFWTIDEAQAYLEEMRRQVHAMRARHGNLRILVDGVHSAVQSPAVIETLKATNTMIVNGPDDRCAVLVASSLIKHQITRTTDNPNVKLFVSRDAALNWLTAHDRAVI